MTRRYGPLTCAVLWLACATPGASQQYSFRHYGAAEGLQNLAVLSLAQDGAGYIWAGTEGGLYRYDGTRFRLIAAAEGLPCATEVHTLFVAPDGALWVNACSHVFRFDGFRFSAVAGLAGMFPGGQDFAPGSGKQVVVATPDGLFSAVPAPNGGFTSSRYALPHAIASLHSGMVARLGAQLWFGCGSQLCREDPGHVAVFGPAQGLPDDSWDGILQTRDAAIWVRSAGRLYRKPAGSERFTNANPGIGSSIFWGSLTETRDGSVMFPTDNGLAIYRNGAWVMLNQSRGLRSSMTSAVLQDREGSIWIALIGAGVARWLGYGEWEAWTKSQGLPSDLVWSVHHDRAGSLWVGTSLGLARLRPGEPTRTFTRANGLDGDNVRSLAETSDGAIWAVVKPGSVAHVAPNTGKIRLLGPRDGLTCGIIHRSFVDHLGRLWLSSACGIFRNDAPATSFHFVHIDAPKSLNRATWFIIEDRHGDMWFTNPDGLWRLSGGQWLRFTKADGLLTANPYVVAIGPDGALWLHDRYDAGIERVQFSGDRILRATPILAADPSSVDVTAFHGFDAFGRLWRGSSTGVSLLANGSWRYLSQEDGLIWDDTDGEAFWPDADGSVWIGTSGGLAHYTPLSTAPPPDPTADPAITQLAVEPKSRVVHAEFSSMTFRAEQLVHFAYRLDGARWTDTAERVLSMPGLPPGRHRLEIRCRVRNGPFSTKIAAAEFDIPPKWWETWWLRSAAALCAVAALFAAIIFKNGRVWRQRNAALEFERFRMLEEKRSSDAAIEAKARFLAAMSHEIRTPLNGVIGLANELEAMDVPPEAREVVQMIRSSSDALFRVISDVLDFSKAEAGKLELEVAPFDLRRTLQESLRLFRAAADEKHLTLLCELAPDLPEWVAGDGNRLRQVVLNLVSNAVKFTASGRVVLSATIAARNEDGYSIAVEVRDTGIGIGPEQLPRLFSSFHQADASISRRYGGTGLGLAISKRLVELMNGTIAAESSPGAGSCFHFTVRLQSAQPPTPARERSTSAPSAAHLRVLVAEDNPVNQRVLIKLLEKLGVIPDLAADGSEAIAAAQSTPYHLILMDVQMPGVDGLTATREIRTRLPASRQPVIFGVTAHATAEYRDICLNAGMDGYLTKPLNRDQLAALIDQLSHRPHLENLPASPAVSPVTSFENIS